MATGTSLLYDEYTGSQTNDSLGVIANHGGPFGLEWTGLASGMPSLPLNKIYNYEYDTNTDETLGLWMYIDFNIPLKFVPSGINTITVTAGFYDNEQHIFVDNILPETTNTSFVRFYHTKSFPNLLDYVSGAYIEDNTFSYSWLYNDSDEMDSFLTMLNNTVVPYHGGNYQEHGNYWDKYVFKAKGIFYGDGGLGAKKGVNLLMPYAPSGGGSSVGLDWQNPYDLETGAAYGTNFYGTETFYGLSSEDLIRDAKVGDVFFQMEQSAYDWSVSLLGHHYIRPHNQNYMGGGIFTQSINDILGQAIQVPYELEEFTIPKNAIYTPEYINFAHNTTNGLNYQAAQCGYEGHYPWNACLNESTSCDTWDGTYLSYFNFENDFDIYAGSSVSDPSCCAGPEVIQDDGQNGYLSLLATTHSTVLHQHGKKHIIHGLGVGGTTHVNASGQSLTLGTWGSELCIPGLPSQALIDAYINTWNSYNSLWASSQQAGWNSGMGDSGVIDVQGFGSEFQEELESMPNLMSSGDLNQIFSQYIGDIQVLAGSDCQSSCNIGSLEFCTEIKLLGVKSCTSSKLGHSSVFLEGYDSEGCHPMQNNNLHYYYASDLVLPTGRNPVFPGHVNAGEVLSTGQGIKVAHAGAAVYKCNKCAEINFGAPGATGTTEFIANQNLGGGDHSGAAGQHPGGFTNSYYNLLQPNFYTYACTFHEGSSLMGHHNSYEGPNISSFDVFYHEMQSNDIGVDGFEDYVHYIGINIPGGKCVFRFIDHDGNEYGEYYGSITIAGDMSFFNPDFPNINSWNGQVTEDAHGISIASEREYWSSSICPELYNSAGIKIYLPTINNKLTFFPPTVFDWPEGAQEAEFASDVNLCNHIFNVFLAKNIGEVITNDAVLYGASHVVYPGCLDQDALNYDPAATWHDESQCEYGSHLGPMDEFHTDPFTEEFDVEDGPNLYPDKSTDILSYSVGKDRWDILGRNYVVHGAIAGKHGEVLVSALDPEAQDGNLIVEHLEGNLYEIEGDRNQYDKYTWVSKDLTFGYDSIYKSIKRVKVFLVTETPIDVLNENLSLGIRTRPGSNDYQMLEVELEDAKTAIFNVPRDTKKCKSIQVIISSSIEIESLAFIYTMKGIK